MPIAVIISIVVQDRHKLESDDLQQIDIQETNEANTTLKNVKKQLNKMVNLKNKSSVKKTQK